MVFGVHIHALKIIGISGCSICELYEIRYFGVAAASVPACSAFVIRDHPHGASIFSVTLL